MNRVEIKICGLSRRDDAAYALDLGADYIGFVLYDGSSRFISGTRLARLLDGLPGEKKAIGVFVNESRARVDKIASDCNLFAIQLNGDEQAKEFEDMTLPVWRSIRFLNGTCSPLTGKWPAIRYVVDSAIHGLYGGTGEIADWKKAARFANKHPTMLAGGLTPGNVANAILATRPAGVDVSSGVERNPRRKDRAKMKAFIDNARALSN